MHGDENETTVVLSEALRRVPMGGIKTTDRPCGPRTIAAGGRCHRHPGTRISGNIALMLHILFKFGNLHPRGS